jgi:CTP:molybdopterin cytidylyltransferase MocA
VTQPEQACEADPAGPRPGADLSRVAAVVLAAGSGSRFERSPEVPHKLLAPLRGRPLIWWAAAAAREAGLGHTWVVQGALELRQLVPPGVQVLDNPSWGKGQAGSLQVAIAEARRLGLEAVVVGLGDQPGVTPAAWRAVASSEAAIAVGTYSGQDANPVRLSARIWHLLPTEGDTGARGLIRARPDLVERVACLGDPADVDTREDLKRWS